MCVFKPLYGKYKTRPAYWSKQNENRDKQEQNQEENGQSTLGSTAEQLPGTSKYSLSAKHQSFRHRGSFFFHW